MPEKNYSKTQIVGIRLDTHHAAENNKKKHRDLKGLLALSTTWFVKCIAICVLEKPIIKGQENT